ncbi:bifunctional P-450:NADPH-P450 reductase [Durotheca rogersii]|uniref:bifunctional P-450:NADPH-P450 reductase n=1 Tax=Durotheca rogersii TaxID=419775 RepID=UPI00221FC1D3|nr:bifunctional P-450:NADPH-P450 reductase [Durotheca rogersii]KAI5855550.1 bifunctional P-450:NADPH-P450 reductase [Durotheca rogersii]
MGEPITPIPEPPGLPFIGNVAEIDPTSSLQSFQRLADRYGEIVRIRIPGRSLVLLSSHALVNEAFDEKRFKKRPSTVLREIREGVHDGLFTAYLEEPNWGIAHRVLMPALGPMGVRDMFDEMHDIGSQLALKWARHGPDQQINAPDDFTRLALDTVALCSMGFRFNSFYSENLHPFINSMAEFLTECGRRSQRLPLPSLFFRSQNQAFQHHIGVLRATAEAVLKERVNDPTNSRKDLLTAMLKGRDSLTGEKMTDSSIIDNLITLLIAGHETTSGTLSYAMHRLLKSPETYRKVQQEVDEVVGKGPVTVEHMSQLPYISAVLRETLRLDSPIPFFGVTAKEDTVLGGKYMVYEGECCLVHLAKSHLDPTVFEDPLSFKPERMLDENFKKLPKNAWKPFGNGVRAVSRSPLLPKTSRVFANPRIPQCLGRPFAWQEAVLAMAIIFQSFNFVLADNDYELHHKQTLTIKPNNFYIRAILRDGLDPTKLEHRLAGTEAAPRRLAARAESSAPKNQDQSMTILYGSNSGTCESMAQRLAFDAASRGFKVSTLDCMDAAVEKLPKDEPIVIITASYEGEPPDNAAQFVSWVSSIEEKLALRGSSYAVFGCGHHDWSQTFHRIPKLMDGKLHDLGAVRIAEMGLADAGKDEMFIVFESWLDNTLWPSLDKLGASKGQVAPLSTRGSLLKVTVLNNRSSMLRQNVREAKVTAARQLTADGEPLKKHIEIQLPAGATYRSGDYLTVLPINPAETVQRVMRRFELPRDASIKIEGTGISLPTDELISANSILGGFVELSQPATRRNVLALADGTDDEGDKKTLKNLATDAFDTEVIARRVSVLDLLEKFPSVNIPLGQFLSMQPPMRVRQYSISSSPLEDPSIASVTFSLVSGRAKSGQGDHVGIASSFLGSLQAGDMLQVSVRPAHSAFHLPATPDKSPLILVAAGSGIAPFRGFIQERATMIKSGRKVAPAVLYHGCRSPGGDDLYADELKDWEQAGAVVVKRAFSKASEKSGGSKYVQDVVWADRKYFLELWGKGALLYVCGSRKVSHGVEETVLRIQKDAAEEKGEDFNDEQAKKWWDEQRNVRHATDVFD